jgi:hypothetical protein
MITKDRKWNHIECSVKTREGRNRVEGERRNKEQWEQLEKLTHVVDINPTISEVTLNVYSLNSPIK